MPNSPYLGQPVTKWSEITDALIQSHPISTDEIVQTVLNAWNDIFKSKVGLLTIGKEIAPVPQMMSFFLHELVAHYLSLQHPGVYTVGVLKTEKDIHCITDCSLSIEIKGSSHPNQIFANRSYAQPQTVGSTKSKDGYYIAINFEKFEDVKPRMPEILLIRFGYLEHTDWIAQTSATGQQARLSTDVYKYKLKQIYPKVPQTVMEIVI